GKPNPKDRPLPAERVLKFEAIYSRHCAGCHGPDGSHGPAPPLNDPLFRSIVSLAALEKVLAEGRPGTPMPAFAKSKGGKVTPAQTQVLIHQIKGIPYRILEQEASAMVVVVADEHGIAPSWGKVAAASDVTPAYALPDAKGDAAQGKQLFDQ